MRAPGARVDPTTYLRAFPLLARHPQIVLAPLLAGVANALIVRLLPLAGGGGADSLIAGVIGLLTQFVTLTGLAIAVSVADPAWRRGKTSFEAAWAHATSRIGDILVAALGFSFVINIAGTFGGFLGPLGIVLQLVAVFFFIYTMPASVLGGAPGAAALNISAERSRANPLPTAAAAAAYIVATVFAPTWVIGALEPLLLNPAIAASDTISTLIVSLVKAVLTGYVALVLAKTFDDLTFLRPPSRW